MDKPSFAHDVATGRTPRTEKIISWKRSKRCEQTGEITQGEPAAFSEAAKIGFLA
jgi:hypothetical protein